MEKCVDYNTPMFKCIVLIFYIFAWYYLRFLANHHNLKDRYAISNFIKLYFK